MHDKTIVNRVGAATFAVMTRCRIFAVAVLLLGIFGIENVSVLAADRTPRVGQWGFCTTSGEVGCIESVVTTDDAGQSVTLQSQSQINSLSGLVLSVVCSSFTMDQTNCDSKNSTSIIPGVSTTCGLERPVELTVSASWAGRRGRSFTLRLRMGDFDPVFSRGNGLNSTQRVVNSDGTYLYVMEGFIDSVNSGSIPSSITNPPLASNYKELLQEFFRTAVTTSSMERSIVYVHPESYLRRALPRPKPSDPIVCVDIPMKGMWVEANSQMFSYGLGFTGKTAKASTKFSFEANSPHFLQDGTTLNPARFRMFIPDEYVTSLGFTSETFSLSSLSVTVADGQVPHPVLTRSTGGFDLNFGIDHYSSPDPVVEIFNANWEVTQTVQSSTPTVVSSPASSVPSSAASSSVSKSVPAGKSISSSTLVRFAGLSRPAGSTVTMRVSRGSVYCRVTAVGIRGVKAGICRVVVSVRVKGRSPRTATVVVTVTR